MGKRQRARLRENPAPLPTAPPLSLLEWITPVAPKWVTDRGYLMASCQFANEADYGRPRELTGHRVELDGAAYRVVTVETFAVPDGHPALRKPVGVILEEL